MKIKTGLYTWVIMLTMALAMLSSPFHALRSTAFALSIEEETTLGEKFLAQVKKEYELIDDHFADQFFNNLGHYLITPLETKPFPFSFYIVNDNTLNAFAAPGGNIFMFSGLIDSFDSIDELSAVICHEIGHVSARHLSQRIDQGKKIGMATMAGVLAGALIGGKAAGALMSGSMAAGMQTQLYYSRTDERQADQLGFRYMTSASFDPGAMISALKKIERGRCLGTEKIPTYLLTHPSGPERMSDLDTMLNSYKPPPPKKEAARFRKIFPFFKTVVRAKSLDFHEAKRLFTLDLKKDPNDPVPLFGLGIIYRERSEYPDAIHYLKKAHEKKPRFIPIITSLAEAYRMNGQAGLAVSTLEEALKLDQGNRSILYMLGLSYEKLDLYKKAIHLFEKLAALPPVRNEVYYHLGLSYGRQDSLALAHYNFGIFFRKSGQIRKAKFHFRKADELSGGDAALREKINKAAEGPR